MRCPTYDRAWGASSAYGPRGRRGGSRRLHRRDRGGSTPDPVTDEAPEGVRVWSADDPATPPAGDQVVVLGVDRSALVAAEFLAKEGRTVTMLAAGKRKAWDVAPTFKWRHAAWLKEFGTTVLPGARAGGWDDQGRICVVYPPEQKAATQQPLPDVLEVDLVVVGGSRTSRQRLVTDLEYRVDVLHVVGDAVAPRSVCQAVHGADRLAVRI
jgi:hypothetical protein